MKKKVSKLEEKEDKLENMEVLEIEEKSKPAPSLTFDEYFQMLRKKNSKILSHHKAPLHSFVIRRGLKNEATEQEFDEVIKSY